LGDILSVEDWRLYYQQMSVTVARAAGSAAHTRVYIIRTHVLPAAVALPRRLASAPVAQAAILSARRRNV
jgi:hypothetical protein